MQTSKHTFAKDSQLPMLKSIGLASLFVMTLLLTHACGGVTVTSNKTTLAEGDSMFLRGFGGKEEHYKWSIQSSDTLEVLKITFRENNCTEDEKTKEIKCCDGKEIKCCDGKKIECCNGKSFCAIQRGKDAPSGTLIITLKDETPDAGSVTKMVLQLPPAAQVADSQESSQADGNAKEAPKETNENTKTEASQPDGGTNDK